MKCIERGGAILVGPLLEVIKKIFVMPHIVKIVSALQYQFLGRNRYLRCFIPCPRLVDGWGTTHPDHRLRIDLWNVQNQLILQDAVDETAVRDIYSTAIVEVPPLLPWPWLITILGQRIILAQEIDQSFTSTQLPRNALDMLFG